MTKQEVINLINQFIIENGNNEITAEVLNPILKAIINQPNDLIGDFNNTPIQGLTVVDKINSLSSMISNFSGVQIYTGALPPDQSPPTTYNVGDFYAQFSATYIGLWQFDGNSWVRQGNIINDGAVDSNLTWSSQKITDMINNKDGVLSIGDLEINGNLITIPAAATWRIAGVTYSNPNAVTLSIPYTAIGYERLDNLVANTNNTFEIVQGVPTNGIAVKPLDQPNKVTVTTISVTDSTINNQNDSTNFIKKDEQLFIQANIINGTINLSSITDTDKRYTNIKVIGGNNLSKVTYNFAYEGMRSLLWNATNANVQIVSGQTFMQNITITPNQIIEFIYSGGKLYLEGGVGGATETKYKSVTKVFYPNVTGPQTKLVVGTITIPANYFKINQFIRCTVKPFYENPGSLNTKNYTIVNRQFTTPLYMLYETTQIAAAISNGVLNHSLIDNQKRIIQRSGSGVYTLDIGAGAASTLGRTPQSLSDVDFGLAIPFNIEVTMNAADVLKEIIVLIELFENE